MNVLLIDPPSLEGNVAEFSQNRSSTPNLGLIYLATYLKSRSNATIKILDMAANNLTFNDIPTVIKNFQPSLVGISAKTFNILSAYKLSRIIKGINPLTIVVVGGAHPTALPEQTLYECNDINAVIMREGEYTFYELYERISNGYASYADVFSDISGIIYRDNHGEIVRNSERGVISDLNSLPFPDMDMVNYDNYSRVYTPNKYRFEHVYPVFASRGCPFDCTFCMPLHTKKHRVRDIENILDEVELLNKKYGAKRIYFEDSLFCSRQSWFTMFCEKFSERGLHKKVQWGFETRIDTPFSEMFEIAKKAGCIYTFFGVESGSEIVLKKSNKRYSKDMIIDKVSSAKRAGIRKVNISIILGLPYETKETIEETLTLIEEVPCDSASINILDVYPGTEAFYMTDRGEGGLRWLEGKRMNWSAYSRSEPMVEVNDVDADYLVSSRFRGKKIVENKVNKIENYIRLMLSVIEYAKKDRMILLKKIKKYFAL